MMNRRRNFCIKASLALNFCVLLYLAMQVFEPMHQQQQQSSDLPPAQAFSSVVERSLNSIQDVPNVNNTAQPTDVSAASSSSLPRRPIQCLEKDLSPKKAMRGQYWVLYNYVPARTQLKCNETVTYTTHCDHTFLDNVVPLVKRWQGPISVALYTPGSDYDDALKAISYYR